MKAFEELKIAVLMGGISSERDVSLVSGANIARALREAGAFEVIEADVSPDRLEVLDDKSVDVYFLATHGKWGEDGRLQGILEEKNLVFTGCGSKASMIAFDKLASKGCFALAGVDIAWSIEVEDGDCVDGLVEKMQGHGEIFVVKPPDEGSSVGVSIIRDINTAAEVAVRDKAKYGRVMIEEFLSGAELTVGVVNGAALPVIEIRSKTEFYDYFAKYEDDKTEYLFDTILDKELVRKLEQDAIKCFDAIGCLHMARVDFILSGSNRVCALEINTLPGFTGHSLLPMASVKRGKSQGQLCREIVEMAIRDRG